MTNPQRLSKGNGRNVFRPVVLSILAGFSLLFSLLFVISPEALSEKARGDAFTRPPSPAPREGEVDSVKAGVISGYSEAQPAVERHEFRVGRNDTFYSIMAGLGVPGAEIQDVVRKTKEHFDLRRLQRGSVIKVTTVDGVWDSVEYPLNETEVLRIRRAPSEEGGATVNVSELPNEVREVIVSGEIETSLYEAGVKAGADPQALMALSDIFAWEIDFASDLRKGDRFSLLYEMLYVEGNPVRSGRVIGAEMVNEGKVHRAVYYEGGGVTGYYDENGKSLRRTLLKSPLRFRRITSHFSRSRFHPILKRYRPHHGIDYGAPVGTPVESAGSGRVVYAGWKAGYGYYVKIKHQNSYSTAYGHLSRIRKGINTGAKVDQGDVIGYVGSTGISTGPHLHYEVWQGRRLVNPLSVKSLPVGYIPRHELERFASVRDSVSNRLSSMSTMLASTAPASHPQGPAPSPN